MPTLLKSFLIALSLTFSTPEAMADSTKNINIKRYKMAKRYYEKGQMDKARSLAEKINSEKIPSFMRTEVILFKNRLFFPIDEKLDQKNENRHGAFTELYAGYNDNPEFESSSTDADAQFNLKLNFNYYPYLSSYSSLQTSYTYGFEKYSSSEDSNTDYHSFQLPISYYWSDWRIRLVPEFTQDTLGAKDYSKQLSHATEVLYGLGSYFIGLRHYYTDYDSQSDDYFYLTGHANRWRLALKKKWSQHSIDFNFNYNDFSYADTPFTVASYSSFQPEVTYSYANNNWDTAINLSYEPRKYVRRSGEKSGREDEKSDMEFQLGYSINKNLRYFTKVQYTYYYSELADTYAYEQSIISVGLTAGL